MSKGTKENIVDPESKPGLFYPTLLQTASSHFLVSPLVARKCTFSEAPGIFLKAPTPPPPPTNCPLELPKPFPSRFCKPRRINPLGYK